MFCWPCISIYPCNKTQLDALFILSSFLQSSSVCYSLTPWSSVLLQKLTFFQLVQNFPAFYGTLRFITAFTTARHLSLSLATSIQSILPHSTYWRSIKILSSPSIRGSPKWPIFFTFSHQNPVYASLLPHTRYMSRPSHYSRFDHPNNIGCGLQIIKRCRSLSSADH